MTRIPAFLASFVAIAPRQPRELVLWAAMPRSWGPRVFDSLGFPPGADAADRPSPPVVLIAAGRWPEPNEPDEPVIAEAAIAVLEQLFAHRVVPLTPALAGRVRGLLQTLSEIPEFAGEDTQA
ncbi:hypothetical protein ACFZ8E_11570 [Methylobacterium sp. HMF5984]|uniref:hypothetical protein n=1 Tax=Methylobacterium sp. HMF5984 TaxID=3367370 RepID=UPI003854113B